MDVAASGFLAQGQGVVVAAAGLLSRLSFADVDQHNALARIREPWSYQDPKFAILARLCHPRALDTRHRSFLSIRLTLDGSPSTLWVPVTIVQMVAANVDSGIRIADLPPEGLGMLVEFAMDGLIGTLEGMGWKVEDMALAGSSQEPRGEIGFLCSMGMQQPFPVVLDTGRPIVSRLSQISREAQRSLPEVPVQVRIPAGVTYLSTSAYLALRQGDTIVFDHSWLKDRKTPVVIGESLILPAKVMERGFALDGISPLVDSRERKIWLSDNSLAGEAYMGDVDTANLDGMEVKLVFELGRQTMTLSELNKLDAGHVFELNRAPDQAVDIHVLNKQIGSGELVMVGERIGVRLTKVLR